MRSGSGSVLKPGAMLNNIKALACLLNERLA
jgi:hypothetical protein